MKHTPEPAASNGDAIGSAKTGGERTHRLNQPASALENALHCPRCGYDLRGVRTTWTASCPIEGTCAECGLQFEWADIFHPVRNEPSWSIEYVPTGAILYGCVNSFMQSFLPWRFWRRLRLSHTIRPARLILYVLLIAVIPITLLYVTVQASVAVMVRSQIERSLAEGYAIATQGLPLFEQARSEWDKVRDLEAAIAAKAYPEFGIDVSRPLEVQVQSQQDWERYWEGTANHYDRMIEWKRRTASAEPRVDISYPVAIFEAVFHPFAAASRGTMVFEGQSDTYVPPADLHDMYLQLRWRRNPAQFQRSTWLDLPEIAHDFGYAIGSITLFLLVFPATFILLPITRSKARVRWSHFGRITAYSAFIPATLFVLFAAIVGIDWFSGNTVPVGLEVPLGVLTLLSLALAIIWWYFAIRTHLRLPNVFWIAAILSFLTILAVGIALGFAQRVMEDIALLFIE